MALQKSMSTFLAYVRALTHQDDVVAAADCIVDIIDKLLINQTEYFSEDEIKDYELWEEANKLFESVLENLPDRSNAAEIVQKFVFERLCVLAVHLTYEKARAEVDKDSEGRFCALQAILNKMEKIEASLKSETRRVSAELPR